MDFSSEQGKVAGCFEYGSEPLVSIKCGLLLEYVMAY